MKVLIGDPDTRVVLVLGDATRRLGHTVLVARDGPQALAVWRAERPDAVLLDDQHLPILPGSAVARALRAQGSRLPVLLMGEQPTDAAVVEGLEGGADDYLAKPVSMPQVLARVQAILRRTSAQDEPPAVAVHLGGGWRLDVTRRTVTTPAGRRVQLTRTECRLLHLLVVNVGQVVSYACLLEACWGFQDDRPAELLKPHVSHLRRKLGLSQHGRHAIQVVREVGYRLVLPGTRPPPSTVAP